MFKILISLNIITHVQFVYLERKLARFPVQQTHKADGDDDVSLLLNITITTKKTTGVLHKDIINIV